MIKNKPEGQETITVKANELLEIELRDFDSGSRNYELTVILEGENATCFIKGRAQTNQNDRKIWKVAQRFAGHNQTGSIDLRGTAENDSFLEFDGSGTLETQSSDADANITEKIILFDNAKAKSLPVLRVETDKVKSAGHGASIAPVDPEKLLYLSSRGISKTEAFEMIKQGFLK